MPFAQISELSRLESYRKSLYRPPYYVHKWWARRPGTVFRAILLDLLLPPGESLMQAFYQRHDFRDTVILDPFMGGGTTVGEALRLGCKVIGCDINPVAWFLVLQAMQDVDVTSLREAFADLARSAGEQILSLYDTRCEKCGADATAQYVSWAKQVDCERCGRLVDLKSNQVLMADMSNRGAGIVICPVCGDPWYASDTRTHVSCERCQTHFVPAATRCGSSNYLCQHCGHTGSILSALSTRQGPPSHRMQCVVVHCGQCGKQYQRPSELDWARYAGIEAEVSRRFDELLLPREPIAPGYNTDQMRRYGYGYWHQMFNARQLLAHHTLFTEIARIPDEGVRDAFTLLASSALEFNSMFCSEKGLGTGAIRHVFAHHAFIPPKEPLEANVWGVAGSSGGFEPLFARRLLGAKHWASQPVERRVVDGAARKVSIRGERLVGRPASSWEQLSHGEANMLLLNHSSEGLPEVPNGTVDFVVTDPPYAGNVMYSELSDYFYVWLRTALADRYAEFTSMRVADEREAVSNVARGRDDDFYEAVIANVFSESVRKLKSGGRLVFTFHHASSAAWRSIEGALCSAGLVVERWWPVHAEMTASVAIQGKNGNGHIDIVFVCARATECTRPKETDTAQLVSELEVVTRLLDADYCALEEAQRVQAATWEASAR